ncbi:uncharacterized protein LOC129901114 [Solanum dulcamara]|uniref:uncharacterized protein LOC129901114 n=1 Tax=Solanum dulcamara TaxID=45834 RepID=UPI0024854B73|nr:uncharacterized protein LOC129901114 [Solanum dulcamara]
MSEDERENDHNKKQKMKSAVQEEEEYEPNLLELLSQMNTNLMIPPKKNRNPRSPDTIESSNRSTDLLPLQHKYIEQGGETPFSVAVEANQNMPESSNVAQGSKKVVLSKRKRPNPENVEQLPKWPITYSENDPDMDILELMSLMETCLDLNSEDAIRNVNAIHN